MNVRVFIFLFLAGWMFGNVQAQDQNSPKTKGGNKESKSFQKRIGIARIQIFASPSKNIPLSEINNLPLFFGEKSDNINYFKRKGYPPTTGDSIRDFTADSLAIFYNQDLTTMSGYDDAGGNKKKRRNYIHDLPTENPQKMAVDSIFDESIDIACFWTFVQTPDKTAMIPSVSMKMEVYDRSGQAQPERSVSLAASEIKTSHFKDHYGIEYDFIKGIKVAELADGGILGNVVADVYLQALNKLLGKSK
jgi:hypothetical protein